MPIFITKGNFEPVFRQARIILNQSAAGELNFRTFEAMALGCACLADNMPTDKNNIASIFTFGENSLPAYPRGDVAKAVDYSVHWLSEEKEEALYELAMRGRQLVLEKHSAKVRAARLDEIFRELAAGSAVRDRLNTLAERRQAVGRAYALLAQQEVLDLSLRRVYAVLQKKY